MLYTRNLNTNIIISPKTTMCAKVQRDGVRWVYRNYETIFRGCGANLPNYYPWM